MRLGGGGQVGVGKVVSHLAPLGSLRVMSEGELQRCRFGTSEKEFVENATFGRFSHRNRILRKKSAQTARRRAPEVPFWHQ